jgi:diacylglycerol kinase (ATP)
MGRELCVIFNPTSGRHRARQRLEQLRSEWGTDVDFQPTRAAGHASELAEQAARAGYAIVAAAGGDGTVHEVVNGLMRAGRPKVRFALVPIGSANDFAYSLERTDASRVDVGRVRAACGERYFACNLGVGLNSGVTLESRRIHHLQGLALYGLATLRALRAHFRSPMLEIQFDDAPVWRAPSLLFSVLNGMREGGFELAPRAKLDDGQLDYVHAGAMSRWQVLRLLPRLASGGAPEHWPGVTQGRCHRVRVRAEDPMRVHVDGEFFCHPEAGVREFEVDVLPAALPVYRFARQANAKR